MDTRLAHRQRQERRQQTQQEQAQLSEEIQSQNDARVQRAREERERQNRALIQESIARTQETEQVGEQTLDKLNQQGQQMNRIADDLDETDETLDRTDAILNRMSRWFCFSLCCGPSEEDLKNAERPEAGAKSKRRAGVHTADGDKAKGATGSENIDDDLDVLGSNLKRLGGLADTMGNAVDDQTEMAGHLNRRTDDVDDKFQKQNTKMDKLLK